MQTYADYNLEAAKMIQWLAKYGSFKSNLAEKLHPDCDPEYYPIGTGHRHHHYCVLLNILQYVTYESM